MSQLLQGHKHATKSLAVFNTPNPKNMSSARKRRQMSQKSRKRDGFLLLQGALAAGSVFHYDHDHDALNLLLRNSHGPKHK
jgi:hypothetical protein